jgi:type II secretory pathway pseudopilin PulG
MTLIEIMVVITIIVIVLGVAIPSMALMLDLKQKDAADTLATTFAYLRDEATLRNVTFRIAFDLDQNTWKVEAGSPDARIFETPEEREAWEKEVQDRLARYTQREIQEGAADEILEQTGRFEGLTDVTLDTDVQLPGGSAFAWAYTPEYGEPILPSVEPPTDPALDQVIYSYIFPDGQMELTVIRIVGERDPEDGYTLIVEPLTGRIHVTSEDTDYRENFSWIPNQGPELPS